MPKISELPTGTVTSAGTLAVVQGSSTIQATVADVVAGAGISGGAVRAYVAFDGSAANMTSELSSANSLNVSSITDHGAGEYTINYNTAVSQAVILIGYEVRAATPYHSLYWGVTQQSSALARIGIGSNNVYYDHPSIYFVAI